MKLWIKDHGKLFRLDVQKNLKIVYQPKKGLSVFANKSFKKGQIVAPLRGKLSKWTKASPEAIQYDKDYFIDTKNYVLEDFINHNCNPNTFINFRKKAFRAIKNIIKNEEITFNYLTTEYDLKKMGTNFKCSCDAKNCFKYIDGFKYLTKNQKLKLKPFLSPFILGKIEE